MSDAERWHITTFLFTTLKDNDGVLTKGMNFVCHDQWFFGAFRGKRCLSGKDGAGVGDRVGEGSWELGAGN